MIYVSPTEVRGIIKTELNDENIEEFISTAHLMVIKFLAPRGVSLDLQTEIKKYLAAHLIASSFKDKTVVSTNVVEETIGDAKIKYGEVSKSTGTSVTISNLKTTRWGQMAVMLDPTGVLGKLGLPPPRMAAL